MQVYHEKQLSSLCGVHALNNLLQRPCFGAGDLAEIALLLDREETALLAQDHVLGAASHRVDPWTGDFSIEVLAAALEQHGIALVNADHAKVAEQTATSPERSEGFLCHIKSHWLALRALGGLWWNLDSRLPCPRLCAVARPMHVPASCSSPHVITLLLFLHVAESLKIGSRAS